MSLENDNSNLNLKIYPEPFRDFLSPKVRKRIFWGVVATHVAVLVLPLIWFSILSMMAPKPLKVLKVSLKDIPSDFPIPSKNPSKDNATPSESASVPDPGPLSPLPPEPAPDPEPTPAQPKPTPPKPTPTPPKPTPVKQPKEDAKKPAKPAKDTKEEVKKTPEKPKKLTADDIRSNSKVVKNEPPKKPPRGGGGPIIDPNKLMRDLKNNGVYQPPGGGGGPIGEVGDPNQNDAYFASVSKFLYNHWQQPGKALLGNTKPSVDVRVNVAANGQIISATIVGRSGNQIMDISVEKLFAEIRVLPVPPKAMEFTIKMMIIDD